MIDLPTLFAALFGIYFATTVATSAKFNPFDTSAVFTGDLRALGRLALGVLFLNVLPFIYFILVLRHLDGLSDTLITGWARPAAVLVAGLGGFGIYRLFCAIVMVRRPMKPDLCFFYSDPSDFNASSSKAKIADKRKPPEDALAYPIAAMFAGGLAWLLISLFVFCWVF